MAVQGHSPQPNCFPPPAPKFGWSLPPLVLPRRHTIFNNTSLLLIPASHVDMGGGIGAGAGVGSWQLTLAVLCSRLIVDIRIMSDN